MADSKLFVRGAGIITDQCADVRSFAEAVGGGEVLRRHLQRAAILDPAAAEGYEMLPRLAIGALHQALAIAAMTPECVENMGLICVSEWGMIDSTAAYLETMFEAAGRYASPRHFSRSVYSTVASMIAIHFQCHGPCLTLAFDARENPVTGALAQARRMLAARRCDTLALVWAEQGGPIAEDLTRRAAKGLHQRAYGRYSEQGVGHGAVSLVLAVEPVADDFAAIDLADRSCPVALAGSVGKPFPMDGAVNLLAWLLRKGGAV